MRISITLPGFSCMVAVARVAVRALLPGNPRVDDAELIVSELATNAVRHSTSRGGQFELVLDLTPGRVRIEVKDGGPFGYPPQPKPQPKPTSSKPISSQSADLPLVHPWTTMQHEDIDRDRGRNRAAEAEEYAHGLALVTAASDKWGHSRYPDHAVWWAELTWPVQEDAPAPDPAPAAAPDAAPDPAGAGR